MPEMSLISQPIVQSIEETHSPTTTIDG